MSTSKQALTKKQSKVLSFIKKYIESNKTSPSIAEIQHHFAYRSPKAVSDFLVILVRKGHIKRAKKGQSRSIILTLDGENKEAKMSDNNSTNMKELIIASKPSGGNPFSIFMNSKEKMLVDKNLLGANDEYFIAKVEDNSLKKDGILSLDLAIIKQTQRPKNKSFALAIFNDELILRKIEWSGDSSFVLLASEKRYPKLKFNLNIDSVTLLGSLSGIIRSYD